MIKYLFTYCLLLFSFLPTNVFSLSGCELFNDCLVLMDVMDNNMGRIQTDDEYGQGSKAGKCQGYLSSVNEMYFLNSASSQTGLPRYCLPPYYTPLLGATAFVQYFRKHPQQKCMYASLLVLKAFETYFPCVFIRS